MRYLYRPRALQAIESHRQKGDKLVLWTTGPDLFVKLVAKELKLDTCLCTTLEVASNGYFTGKMIGPLCFGKGKVQIAQKFAQNTGVELKNCSFYSDSMSDVPFFEAVGKQVAVNPDPRLRKKATSAKWQIVDWGEPACHKKS